MSQIEIEEGPDISAPAASEDAAAKESGDAEAMVPRDVALPSLRVALAPEAVMERLDKASRRGRLAGFARLADTGGTLEFKVSAFGHPFDREVIGGVVGEAGGGSAIWFRTKLLMKAPIVFALSFVFSIWPGLPIMDSLIPARWGWWPTWWWYVPLSVLPLAALPRMWKKSEQTAHNEAHKAVRKIATELGATQVGAGTG